MVARELPSDEVLASWQHVEQRALDLRAAGVPGSLQDLRVRAYLDLLQERDSRAAPAGPAAEPAGQPARPAGPGPAAPDQPPPDTGPPGPPGPAPGRPWWPRTAPAAPDPGGPGGGRSRRSWSRAPVPARMPARAWPPWSPSPSP